MIDPVTAFGVAVTAFNTVQKLVKAAKEIESVAGQLSKWYSAVQSFNESANKNKKKDSGSASQEALEITLHRQKLKEMEYQLYILIAGTYGQEVYQSMVAERRRIKADREKAAKAAKQKKKEMIINGFYLFMILFLLVLCYHTYEYLIRNLL